MGITGTPIATGFDFCADFPFVCCSVTNGADIIPATPLLLLAPIAIIISDDSGVAIFEVDFFLVRTKKRHTIKFVTFLVDKYILKNKWCNYLTHISVLFHTSNP